MIEVFVVNDGEPLGTIEILRDGETFANENLCDYVIRFAVDRGSAIGAHVRTIHSFPRTQLNCFALVLQALNTLEEKELSLERDYDVDSEEAAVPSDLARRLNPIVRAIQDRLGRLHHNGSSVWGGQ
jgi:hypothetical protein